MSRDYRSTVFLPRAEGFPMRAGLPRREPEILARWEEMDLFGRLRQASKGRERFVLHDGPPYANGHLHMGHALNKILKDVINRSQQMLGYDAHYVPGWDCHGLPIEWKVEEEVRAQGRDKDAVDPVAFRRECREFAETWIAVQTEEFKRLGVVGNWAHPYTTMSYAAEAQIAREVGKFLMNGGLYRGWRPVLWSVAEKTALADAEVEYHDHTSPTVWVRFPVTEPNQLEFAEAKVVIWTTTPWTLPGNRAIAFDPKATYAVIRVEDAKKDSGAQPNERLIVAKALVGQLVAECGIEEHEVLREGKGRDLLAGVVCAHPLRGRGYDFEVPLLEGDFVTMEQGSGLVHIAPGHGTDDYNLGRRHGLEVPHTVDGDGIFTDEVPLFAGARIYHPDGRQGDANAKVVEALGEAGALIARGRLRHSYPHSWRSKVPLIFRNTPQWFISMEANGLRATALAAIDATRFVPAAGKVRLRSMIETRPDWCVSRQRLWGVPLPLFVHRETGEPLKDERVLERIAEAFEQEGGDAWFTSPPERFLGDGHDAADYEQVTDIVEVWFDSGSTHAFVLEAREDELEWPASLYLEGSDQHRGWFHTSLLEAAGTRGRAPYEAVLTHGFVLDEDARKMSKSQGNVTDPNEVMAERGADILRLWVVASDYAEDLRIGEEILRYQVDAYRRLRNTLRYLIGNLADFAEAERVAPAAMPELERWVLHRLAEIDAVVRRGVADFDFLSIHRELYQFCAVDLSAFYFDVRKDCLYCDRPDSPRRRACRTVLDHLFGCLTAWLAPILCYTAEEAWWARGAGPEDSVHLRLFPEVPADWRDDALAGKWAKVRRVRRVVTGALEVERAERRIGANLQAAPRVVVADEDLAAAVAEVDLAEVCITSAAELERGPVPAGAFTLEEVPGVGVVPEPAPGEKCQRCWRVLPEVGRHPEAPGTCGRCADAVAHLGAAAQ